MLKTILKRFIVGLSILTLILPLSLNISYWGEGNYQSNRNNFIELNIANAINLDCDNFVGYSTDVACSVSEGILNVWEVVWFYTTQIALVLFGYILDIFMFLSINSSFYRSGLIERGWELLRDFTNIIFIFSFLVMAFRMVLGMKDADTKRQLIKTILVALTVNFSIFISYAVIDASNLLARTFYNKIEAKGAYTARSLNGESDNNATKVTEMIGEFLGEDAQSVSLAIASNVNPQSIITGNASKGFLENFIIITGAGLINVLLIYLFYNMISVFLGRTLGLTFSSMLSAVAFTTLTIPGMQNKSYIGFNKWLEQLISTAFMAPVFMFFIYLSVVFLKDKGFLASLSPDPSQNFLSRLLTVFIPFLVIGGILMLAKKISEDMVGDLGKMAVKGTTMLAGGVIAAPFAVGAGAAALGGGLAAGGGMLARGAGMGLSRMGATRAGASLMRGGKTASRIGNKMMSWKADPTKLPGFKTVLGKDTTSMIGKVTGKSALGHYRNAQKKRGSVFGSDYGKLNSDAENQELKDANNAANAARRKAESKYESNLYGLRYQTELARKKRDNVKEGFVNSEGKNGGYKEASEQSQKEAKNISDLSATLVDIKKKTDASEKDAKDKFQAMNQHKEGTKEHRKAKQEWQTAVNVNVSNNKEKTDVEVKLNTAQTNKGNADKFIENISADYNAKQKELNKKRAEQKSAGDIAETAFRNASATKASSDSVAKKILDKEKAKGNGLEDAIKKAIKDNNIKLDDN